MTMIKLVVMILLFGQAYNEDIVYTVEYGQTAATEVTDANPPVGKFLQVTEGTLKLKCPVLPYLQTFVLMPKSCFQTNVINQTCISKIEIGDTEYVNRYLIAGGFSQLKVVFLGLDKNITNYVQYNTGVGSIDASVEVFGVTGMNTTSGGIEKRSGTLKQINAEGIDGCTTTDKDFYPLYMKQGDKVIAVAGNQCHFLPLSAFPALTDETKQSLLQSTPCTLANIAQLQQG